ncbi:MAG TPA: isocitrate/isopropylmalate family dehydrogenase, partial [Leptospiraceae bacterium]|nr:isocitrate/isopropylmalate family dehydrogenase [Leptospiraceae bacterium]
KGIANPIAQILSAALLLRYSFSMETEALRIEKAVREVIKKGLRTGDIAEKDSQVVGTEEIGSEIEKAIERV